MEQLTRLGAERGVAARLRPGGPHYIEPEIQAIRLGPGCVILGLPGEFFTETGLRIQADAGIPHLLIACYANHYVYYVVPEHAFDRGGYEAGVIDARRARRGDRPPRGAGPARRRYVLKAQRDHRRARVVGAPLCCALVGQGAAPPRPAGVGRRSASPITSNPSVLHYAP